MDNDDKGTTTLSVSMVTQGKTKFYTLTMPIEVLAECAIVEARAANPIEGFQRHLDARRAEEIARYVDEGNSIPNSIVLSAQAAANLKYTRSRRSITFTRTRASFFIVDGQHRVFGFSKAKTKTLRVPVVIYDGLTRAQECKLFMDINTKQRPVPNALLLDIKRLAEAETDEESLLRDIFDRFAKDTASPLLGRMSAAESKAGTISRVTFNAAVKAILHVFDDKDLESVYLPLSAYLTAWCAILRRRDADEMLLNPTVFKAIVHLFPDVAERVSARDNDYQVPSFEAAMKALDATQTPKLLAKHGGKFRDLHGALKTELTKGFKVRSK